MSVTTMQGSMSERIQELWTSGRQVAWFVTDENARVGRAIKTGIQAINEERPKDDRHPVIVVTHDRWGGFCIGLPDVPMAKDKTNNLGNAIQIAIMTESEIKQHFSEVTIDFDPKDDLVFLFESVDEEIKSQALVLTCIRRIIQSNMASTSYIEDKKTTGRGRRMLVFLSATAEMPATIPELKPEIVPLPDYTALKGIVMDILEPLFERYTETKGKKGVRKLSDEDLDRIINSMHGMTAQDAEEILALALVRHKGIKEVDDFMDTIEQEKARVLAKIPGLRYIPKQEIVTNPLPGYEELTGFVDARLSINAEKAKAHGITPLRGIAVGGAPGCGKTEVAKYVARRLGRICLIWNMGESKGGIVGASEQNCRQVIEVARAMRALVLCDDVDKGALGGAAKNYGGDGGTTGGMVQMLLTEMSDPFSEAIYIFTFNRVPDLPELLRPGRVDERFYVERPNGRTRLAILKDHIGRVGLKVDDEPMLRTLAYELCQDWTGAELAHVLVKDEAIRVLAEEEDTMQVERMCTRARDFTPMVKQNTFAEDIRQMEAACSQFKRIGCLPETEVKSSGPSRSRRMVAT